jgi:CubicO group peptidase (beta-lactamase class C family)
MHLHQESEWEGEMFGKRHDFVGRVAFGEGERQPRELQPPGSFYEYNDVRVNRLGLSLLRVFRKLVPEVFRDEVMNLIGASNGWKWVPYHNSYVEIDGRRLASVSGGTRWGGGVWIDSWDMARFGYLWLRGGRWGERQILPAAFVRAALTPSLHGPDYGYLWWLNTGQRNYPGLPKTAYGARGAGSNTITILPEQDLVVVCPAGSRRHPYVDPGNGSTLYPLGVKCGPVGPRPSPSFLCSIPFQSSSITCLQN